MAEIVITAVEFEADGVHLSYMQVPDDLRAGGAVVASHTLSVADNADYGDAIEGLRRAARDLLGDALEDFATTDPVEPTAAAEDDDDDD